MIRRGCANALGCSLVLLLVAVAAVLALPALNRYLPHDLSLVRSSISRFEAAAGGSGEGARWGAPSAADCSWGESTLKEDGRLDLAGGVEYPQWASYYASTAAWWRSAESTLAGLCGQAPPKASACVAAIGHFELAYTAHANASTAGASTGIPDDTSGEQDWNHMWMSNYLRLERIFLATGCGGVS